MAEPRKIQIAVSGGGVAGAALARALYQQSHIEVDIYESAPEFSEKGMAIGLAINAQRALGKLVPDLEDMFERAGAVMMNSSRIMLVSSLLRSECLKREADEYMGRGTPCRHESDRCRGGEAGEDGASCGAAA